MNGHSTGHPPAANPEVADLVELRCIKGSGQGGEFGSRDGGGRQKADAAMEHPAVTDSITFPDSFDKVFFNNEIGDPSHIWAQMLTNCCHEFIV